jgi:hypothetical protein
VVVTSHAVGRSYQASASFMELPKIGATAAEIGLFIGDGQPRFEGG